MAARQAAPLPLPLHPIRQAAGVEPTLCPAGLGLSRATFGCEGEDAQLTGMTRSPLRRLLGLSVGSSLRFEPQRVPSTAIPAQRIA